MQASEILNELQQLDDDVLVDVNDAAAYLCLKVSTLNWTRTRAPHRSPKYVIVGSRAVRYRVGDLKAYISRREE